MVVVYLFITEIVFHPTLYRVSIVTGNIECLVIHVGSFVVAAAYRPPTGKRTMCSGFVVDLLYFLNPLSVPFFVMGDLNVNMAAHDPST